MFFDDNADSGDGSALWSSVIDAVSQTAQTAIVSSQSPNLGVPYPQPVQSGGFIPGAYGQTSGGVMSWLIVGLLAVAGFFAFTKLR